MGIGTSSSSSGASAPRANAYAVNRDASELRRSPARNAPASAQPGPMHVIYTSVDTATPRHRALRRYKVTHAGTSKTARLAREFAASKPFSQVVAGVGFEPT